MVNALSIFTPVGAGVNWGKFQHSQKPLEVSLNHPNFTLTTLNFILNLPEASCDASISLVTLIFHFWRLHLTFDAYISLIVTLYISLLTLTPHLSRLHLTCEAHNSLLTLEFHLWRFNLHFNAYISLLTFTSHSWRLHLTFEAYISLVTLKSHFSTCSLVESYIYCLQMLL